MDNGSAAGPGNTVVVCLAQSSDGADASLGEEVHSQIAQALLCDHDIWLVLSDVLAQVLNVVLFQLEELRPAQPVKLSMSELLASLESL